MGCQGNASLLFGGEGGGAVMGVGWRGRKVRDERGDGVEYSVDM